MLIRSETFSFKQTNKKKQLGRISHSLEIYSQPSDFFNAYINILMYLYILSFLYLLGAGPRPSIRIPQWPWDVQLYQKDHGPALSPRSGNTGNVPETSAGSYGAAPTVHSVCYQHVDSWNNLEPADWTVFRHAIRTNNDSEGWHHSLNRRASGRGQLPMYLLIKLLHREAMLTAIQIRLVSEKKLRRIQRRTYGDLQTKIFKLWDEFDAGETEISEKFTESVFPS